MTEVLKALPEKMRNDLFNYYIVQYLPYENEELYGKLCMKYKSFVWGEIHLNDYTKDFIIYDHKTKNKRYLHAVKDIDYKNYIKSVIMYYHSFEPDDIVESIDNLNDKNDVIAILLKDYIKKYIPQMYFEGITCIPFKDYLIYKMENIISSVSFKDYIISKLEEIYGLNKPKIQNKIKRHRYLYTIKCSKHKYYIFEE